MSIDHQEMRLRIQTYAQRNDRCSWLSEEELIVLGFQADEKVKQSGENFIAIFDQLVFKKSFENGAPKR